MKFLLLGEEFIPQDSGRYYEVQLLESGCPFLKESLVSRISQVPHPIPRTPGPIKCFSAPCHQISGKSAPQKARNLDKAEFATKVLKSS